MFDFQEPLQDGKADNLSPITLAFIGDAVWSLYVRTKVSLSADYTSGKLQKLTSDIVSAHGQSLLVKKISPLFTEQETAIFKRGRNSKKPSHGKNISVAEYNDSTGFEALVGWLYLTGRKERFFELFGGEL